jgi:uncharacterized cupin superfamily protein
LIGIKPNGAAHAKLSAFDPLSLSESNANGYPPPYHKGNRHRFNRRLGDHAGLTHFGVVLTRIVPGASPLTVTPIPAG